MVNSLRIMVRDFGLRKAANVAVMAVTKAAHERWAEVYTSS
jgi:hypothetical protein